ncbi:MAG: hypothetical protein R8G66_04585 [Cytophagales bacterium]|nr:hypothetical protein [Cytophagales bacterium]
MRVSSFIVVFFLFAVSAKAQQFSSDFWHDGFVVTAKGDTLRGQVKYDMETNVVLLQNRSFKTLSSFQVFYFNIYDKLVENYRQFYSIPYRLKYDHETPVFFELLFEGPLSLLAREAIVQETVPLGNSVTRGTSVVRDKVALEFYFVDKDGDLAAYSGKKSDLYEIMSLKGRKVKEFIKSNSLKTDNARDLVRITAFYNSI